MTLENPHTTVILSQSYCIAHCNVTGVINLFHCRYVNSLRPTDRPIRIMERSVYSGYACFLATSRERGEITDAEYALAEKWFKFMDSQVRLTAKP